MVLSDEMVDFVSIHKDDDVNKLAQVDVKTAKKNS